MTSEFARDEVGQVQFRVLGPLEAEREGEPVDLGPRKQREALSLLLLHAGRVVSTERLLEGVWGDEVGTKENALWVTISRIRATLDPDRQSNGDAVLVTKDHGYLLDVAADQLDIVRFESLVDEGKAKLDFEPAAAAEVLQEALDLWRGEAWSDVRFHDFAQSEINRLEELRLSATEDLLCARLESGDSERVAAEAAALVSAHPLRERPVRLLMLGLYRSGRQAEALRAYTALVTRLGDELGIEPSPELRRLEEQVLLHDWNVRPRPTGADGNPFKGLEPFREEDSVDFHGRDRIVSSLVRRIADGETLLTLVGASGSGKSSIVRAGVIPALRKGAVPGSDGWLVATMVPGRHPFAELEAALLRSSLDAPSSLGEQLSGDASGILRAALRVMPDEQSRLVLVVDQFEELFTLTSDPNARDRFLGGLLTAADDPRGRITVLLTLRADFYDRPLQHAAFATHFGDGIVNVAPLLPNELEDAAQKPAERVGATIEPALVGALITDVLGQPGTLPLFQYVLTDLFESHEGTLTLDDYRALGGVGGALSKRAEEAYGRLDADGQAACRQLFLRMVAVAEGAEWSRRRLHADELRALGFTSEVIQRVVGTLVEARLLTTDRDPTSGRPTIEVAHESLLTVWDRLAHWIEEAAEDLKRHAVLSAAVRDWTEADEDPGFLWAETRLERYREWSETATIDLSVDEERFLGESVQTEQERTEQVIHTERKARNRTWGLVAAIVGMVALGFWALWPILFPDPAVLLVRIAGDFSIQGQLETGLEQAAADFDLEPRVVELAANSTQQIDAALAKGPDLVIAGLDAQMAYDWDEAALRHPDITFVSLQSLIPHDDTGNWIDVLWSDQEGAYLAGVVAAMQTDTGTIGYIGAHPGMVSAFLPGFEAGVADTDPTVTVASAYTPISDPWAIWLDTDGPASMARALIAEGADILFSAHGKGGLGVLDEVAQANNSASSPIWGIGVDADEALLLRSTDPSIADHILTSMVKRFDLAVYRSIERFLTGELTPVYMNVATDGYEIAGSSHLSSVTMDAVDDAKDRIASGAVIVPELSDHPATFLYPVDAELTLSSQMCDPETGSVAVGDTARFTVENESTDLFALVGLFAPLAPDAEEGTSQLDGNPQTWTLVPPNGSSSLSAVIVQAGTWAMGCSLWADEDTFVEGSFGFIEATGSSPEG